MAVAKEIRVHAALTALLSKLGNVFALKEENGTEALAGVDLDTAVH